MKSVYQRAEISVKKTGGVQLEPAQPGEVYRLTGKEYPVSAHVKFQGGGSVPLVDLPIHHHRRGERLRQVQLDRGLEGRTLRPGADY